MTKNPENPIQVNDDQLTHLSDSLDVANPDRAAQVVDAFLCLTPGNISPIHASILLDATWMTYAETAKRHGYSLRGVQEICRRHRPQFEALQARRNEVLSVVSTSAVWRIVDLVSRGLDAAAPPTTGQATSAWVQAAIQLHRIAMDLASRSPQPQAPGLSDLTARAESAIVRLGGTP